MGIEKVIIITGSHQSSTSPSAHGYNTDRARPGWPAGIPRVGSHIEQVGEARNKYLSGTEKYAAQEVEDLQDALARYHPFG